MRILVLGSSGTLGSAVAATLAVRHEVLGASRHHKDRRGDLSDEESLLALLESCGPLDAVVSTAGETPVGLLERLDADALFQGIRTKLLGQITLARLAAQRLSDGGSITLTSGLLNLRPIRGSISAAVANGALEGFVRAAALELPRGIRINLVSPGLLEESLSRYGQYFPNEKPIAADEVAQAYVQAVEGGDTGQVYAIHG